jgi:hypothetical protein
MILMATLVMLESVNTKEPYHTLCYGSTQTVFVDFISRLLLWSNVPVDAQYNCDQ